MRYNAVAKFIICLLPIVFGFSPFLLYASSQTVTSPLLTAITYYAGLMLSAYLCSRVRPQIAVAVLAFILCSQPIVTMLLSSPSDADMTKFLVATKEVFTGSLFMFLLVAGKRCRHFNYADKLGLAFLAVYAVYFVTSPSPFMLSALSFREAFMIVLFYFLGRIMFTDFRDMQDSLYSVLIVAVFLCVFGMYERFFMSDALWNQLGAVTYSMTKRGSVALSLNGLVPNQWYTYVGGIALRRMVSTVLDPTSLARFLALPLVAMIFIKGRIRNSYGLYPIKLFLIALLASCVFLSFGRGGELEIITTVGFVAYYKYGFKVLIPLVPLILYVLLQTQMYSLDSEEAARHAGSLIDGLHELVKKPLGTGLGTAGQEVSNFTTGTSADGSESYFASVAYQTGLPGVVSYFLFLLSVTFYLVKKSRPLPTRIEYVLMAGLGFSVFWTSLLSDSAIAPISSGLALYFVGTTVSMKAAMRAQSLSEQRAARMIRRSEIGHQYA